MKEYFKHLGVGLATVAVVLFALAVGDWFLTDPVGEKAALWVAVLGAAGFIIFFAIPLVGAIVLDIYHALRRELDEME